MKKKNKKMLSDIDFLDINLEYAANGMHFGSHSPMNDFSKKLLNEDWRSGLMYSGYSSSRVDFEIVDAQYKNIFVYTSYKSITSGDHDKVTIRLENDYDEKNVCYRDNLSVDEALRNLENYIKKKTVQNDNVRMIFEGNNIVIDFKDGWFSTEQMLECTDKLKKANDEEKKNCIFNIENIEKFPWEIIDAIYIISKNKEYKKICVCSEEILWNEYTKIFEEYYPGEKLQHFNNIENAFEAYK